MTASRGKYLEFFLNIWDIQADRMVSLGPRARNTGRMVAPQTFIGIHLP